VPDSIRQLAALIAEDWRAHGRDWTRPGFRAVAVHRFGVWRMSVTPKPLRAPLSLIYRWAFRRCRNRYGIELPYSVALGRRVVVEHQGGIVVHGRTVIGDDCVIRQNCTLGIRRMDALGDAPVLARGVQLGAGSVVLGRVRLGENAQVGANAVVLIDVPAGGLAIGVPARLAERRA